MRPAQKVPVSRKKKDSVNLTFIGPCIVIQDDTKKRELFKNPTNIEEIQEKKIY